MTDHLQETGFQRNLGMLIGRVFLSAIFIWSGYGKLMGAAGTKAYFTSLGVPMPELAFIVTVTIELLGGLLLLLGIQARSLGLVFAIWCLATAVAGHTDFSVAGNDIHFMKNVAMSGGFIFVALFGGGAYGVGSLLRK